MCDPPWGRDLLRLIFLLFPAPTILTFSFQTSDSISLLSLRICGNDVSVDLLRRPRSSLLFFSQSCFRVMLFLVAAGVSRSLHTILKAA